MVGSLAVFTAIGTNTLTLNAGRRWKHVWSGGTLMSGHHYVDTSIGEPPVFYRAGAAAGKRFMNALAEYGVR